MKVGVTVGVTVIVGGCKCDSDGVRHLSAEPAAIFLPSGDQQHLNRFCDDNMRQQ